MSSQTSRIASCMTAMLVAALASAARADQPAIPFGVEFVGCVESIGVTLAPTENVLALTPPGFIPVGIGTPVSPVVARTSDCLAIVVDGKARPGAIVQIGAVIVPPIPQGEDIDNYTFWYYTTDARLARRLQDAGIRAQHVPAIDYDLDPAFPGMKNRLAVAVPPPGDPRLRIAGTVVPSLAPSGDFRAIWWQQTPAGRVRMDTNVPVISIGTADLTLTTTAGSGLGALIGGTSTGFAILQQFNLFLRARMQVGVAP